MAIFNCYVSSPEGSCFLWWLFHAIPQFRGVKPTILWWCDRYEGIWHETVFFGRGTLTSPTIKWWLGYVGIGVLSPTFQPFRPSLSGFGKWWFAQRQTLHSLCFWRNQTEALTQQKLEVSQLNQASFSTRRKHDVASNIRSVLSFEPWAHGEHHLEAGCRKGDIPWYQWYPHDWTVLIS